MKAIRRCWLANMPFDKWTNNHYVHATGAEVQLEDGSYAIEYEDNPYEDSEDCVYYDEYIPHTDDEEE